MELIKFLVLAALLQCVACMVALPKSIKECPGKENKVLEGKMEKINRTHVSYTGNVNLPFPVDDKTEIHVKIAVKSLGTWKENFLNFNLKKGCNDVKNVLPEFLLQVAKSAKNSTYKGGCPVPKGTLYVDHFVPHTSLYIPPSPKGEYKATLLLVRSGSKSVCVLVDFDLTNS